MWRVAGADHHHVFDAGRRAHLVDDRSEERVGETHPRTGVGEDVLELLRREPQIQRIDHTGTEERPVVALEELMAVQRQDREPVARRNPEPAECTRQPRNPVEVLTELAW